MKHKRQWIVMLISSINKGELISIKHLLKKNRLPIYMYCPMESYRYMSTRHVVTIKSRPLLFNYMFMHYDVREVPSIVFPVAFKGLCRPMLNKKKKEVTIDYSEVKRMKLTEKSMQVRFNLELSGKISIKEYVGSTVIVRDGTLSGLCGKVVHARSTGKLIVELHMFDRTIKCDMDAKHVEVVSSEFGCT